MKFFPELSKLGTDYILTALDTCSGGQSRVGQINEYRNL